MTIITFMTNITIQSSFVHRLHILSITRRNIEVCVYKFDDINTAIYTCSEYGHS